MLEKTLAKIEEESILKSNMLYDYIDSTDGYYINSVDVKFRSRMNVPFRIKNNDALETKFIKGAEKEGLLELKGHRVAGGIRASLSNAMPVEGVQALIDFMKKFREENP